MTFNIPKLLEWNNFYPCPDQKVRLGVKLFHPSMFIENRAALGHDFYYFSDEFSVIFHPLLRDDEVYMLVEGPHENPLGERIPILSTWQHLKVDEGDVYKSGIQHSFAYYDNRWWEAKFEYDYLYTNIDICPYINSYWCKCNKHEYGRLPGIYYQGDLHIEGHDHIYFARRYEHYTIFKDTKKTDFHTLVKNCYPHNLGIVADWLEDRGDFLAQYIRLSDYNRNIKNMIKSYEITHMCESIKLIENDRAARLLLLSEGIRR